MKKIVLMFFILATCFSEESFSADGGGTGGNEAINQLQFFYGQNSIDPQELNDLLAPDGFAPFKKLTLLGFQAGRHFARYLDLGLRITTKNSTVDSTVSAGAGAWISQVSILLIVDIPVVKTESVKLDVLAGFGGSSTRVSVKTASQDGSFNRPTSNIAMAGLSAAFGKKYVFLKFEGGYEYSRVDSFTSSGTPSTHVDKVDLSGGYMNVGILIDELKLGRL